MLASTRVVLVTLHYSRSCKDVNDHADTGRKFNVYAHVYVSDARLGLA